MVKQLLLVLCAAAPLVRAQTVDKIEVIQVEATAAAQAETAQITVMDGGPEMRVRVFPGKALKGAPYAAESTTETVQVLPDGNRIVNKQSSKMYRDGEGRTRVENSFAPVGPWMPQHAGFSMTIIDDPVSGEHYTLNNHDKIATKMSFPKGDPMTKAVVMAGSAGARIQGDMVHGDVVMSGPAMLLAAPSADGPFKSPAKDFKQESLGKQTIEGLICDGTRTTVTIPAGQIGNEREIVIVSETWFSPELGMEVLRKHNDPRGGETTYKISNIVRGEPSRSLFEVPADYKLDDVSGGDVFFHKEIRHESSSKKEE